MQIPPERRDGNQKDFTRIKSNIGKMIDQNAPEADIDAYLSSEGVTPEELQSDNASMQAWQNIPQQQNSTVGDNLLGGLKDRGVQRYRIEPDGTVRFHYADGREEPGFLRDLGPQGQDQYRSLYGKDAPLQVDVAGGTSRPESFGQGVQEGFTNVLDNAASKLNYLTGGITDKIGGALGLPTVDQANANRDASFDASPYQGSGAGRFTGEVLGLAPTALIPGGAFVQGAAGAGIMSQADNPLGIAADAAIGGGVATAGNALLRGGSQVANPNLPPALQTLFREGVRATPGQMARATGTMAGRGLGVVEDTVANIPGVGAPIVAAQQAGVRDFARAPVNRALRSIGVRLPRDVQPGYNAIDYAQDQFRAAYQEVLPRLNGQLDNGFQTRINTIQQRANVPADSDAARAVENATTELGNAFAGVGQNGVYNGRSLRDASERLNDLASAWRRSDDPYMRVAGDVATQYRQQLHALARRQNPQQATRLRDIDRGYASLVRAERAALAGDGGIPTPRQYQSAVRQSDPSARRRQFAAGNALDQDLSNAGVEVLANRASQGGSTSTNGLIALVGGGFGAISGNPAAQMAAGAGLATLGGTAVTHNPLLLRGIQATLGRQTNLSPEIARVLNLLAAGSAPLSIAAANGE